MKKNEKFKIHQIKRINEISPNQFKQDFLQTHTPLIFRSFAADWKATSHWDFNFFRKYAGELIVPVSGDWAKNNSTQINRGADYKMAFKDFLTAIEKGPTEYRLFAFNLFKSHPELKNDFNYPRFANRWIKMPFLFFGGAGSTVRLHYDFDNSDVFLTQFSGIKKITLFHPDNSDLLYRQPFTTHSHLDLSDSSFKDIPSFPFLEALIGTIEEGDTLYIPSNYWHFIKYETGGFSMALRSLNTSNLAVIKGAWKVIVVTPLDTILGKIFSVKWANYKLKMARRTTEINVQKKVKNKF